MILDSSALVAIVLAEPGSDRLLTKIKGATAVGIGAPTLLETLIVLAARLRGNATPPLLNLLRELAVEVIPFTREHYDVAFDAYLAFGKGRHPAGLNFGDCQSYATAVVADQPLLYTGNDFTRAGVPAA